MVGKATWISLIGGSISIGVLANPLSGVLLIPMVILGTWAHELAHFLPLRPWGEGLYIEVWPFLELRPGESADVFGHVGGEISQETPPIVLRFSMVAPLVLFGWIPVVLVLAYGFPSGGQIVPGLQAILQSPLQFALMMFLIPALLLSPADIYHLQNASRIKQVGSLDMVVWDTGRR